MADDIIREYNCRTRKVTIRSASVQNNLLDFLALYTLATADWPNLDLGEVEIGKYGGKFGIRFRRISVPAEYQRTAEK